MNQSTATMSNRTRRDIVLYQKDWSATAAVCDPWSNSRDRGLAVVGLSSENGYQDYRRLLERNDIDAVFCAAVAHEHGPIGVDALDAGKHVYLEKTITNGSGRVFEPITYGTFD